MVGEEGGPNIGEFERAGDVSEGFCFGTSMVLHVGRMMLWTRGKSQGTSHGQKQGTEKNASGSHKKFLNPGRFIESFFHGALTSVRPVRLASINLSSSEV